MFFLSLMMLSLARAASTPLRHSHRYSEMDSSANVNTPPRSITKQNSSPSCFVTPKKSTRQEDQSPFKTPRTAAYIRLKNEHENIQSTYDYGECRVVLSKNMAVERGRQDLHEIEKTTLYHLLIEQGRSWCIICKYNPEKTTEEDTYNDIVAVAPMSYLDYEALNDIRREYVESQKGIGEVFLERQYGTREQFIEKLDLINSVWEAVGNVTRPILYSQPARMFTENWEGSDPHFDSSIPFTVFYGFKKRDGIHAERDTIRTEVVGDIWFSHFDDSNLLCLYGTTERSTMIASKHQGKNIGPTAVKGLYSQLVHPWTNQNVILIDYEKKQYDMNSLEIFDGVVSYVSPQNFKSIGQNIRSGNIIFGINDEGMLMFRAANPNSCTMSNILNSLREDGRITDYETIKILLNKLYPSNAVIKLPSSALKDFRIQQEQYVRSSEYNKVLHDFISQFSTLFLIDSESPLKQKVKGSSLGFPMLTVDDESLSMNLADKETSLFLQVPDRISQKSSGIPNLDSPDLLTRSRGNYHFKDVS